MLLLISISEANLPYTLHHKIKFGLSNNSSSSSQILWYRHTSAIHIKQAFGEYSAIFQSRLKVFLWFYFFGNSQSLCYLGYKQRFWAGFFLESIYFMKCRQKFLELNLLRSLWRGFVECPAIEFIAKLIDPTFQQHFWVLFNIHISLGFIILIMPNVYFLLLKVSVLN
jgi:hypothetical protein